MTEIEVRLVLGFIIAFELAALRFIFLRNRRFTTSGRMTRLLRSWVHAGGEWYKEDPDA